MKFDQSAPSMAVLWRVTAAVALILLIITLILVVNARKPAAAHFTGYINDQTATVYLRNRPTATGRTLAILNPGTEVYVDRSTSSEGMTWYHVNTESGSGWIPEENLNLRGP